jgi:hypothetical protein
MYETRLIMLDGLSGSGKSATATYLALQLQSLGAPYRYYWELEVPHPINTRSQLDGRNLSTQELVDLNLAKWKSFAEWAQEQDVVTILDGKPFHISVMNMALQDNITQQQIVDFVGAIAELTRPLNPTLIYLRQDDIGQAIRRLGADRGEEWIEDYVQLIESHPTFGGVDFSGLAGMVQFLGRFRDLVEGGFDAMDVRKLSIDTTTGNWHSYYRQVNSCVFSDADSFTDCVEGNRHLSPTDDTPVHLVFDNRTSRSLVVYWWPFKARFAEHVFEMHPKEVIPYETILGYRFRVHDTNSGEIMRDAIASESRQRVVIGG